MNGNYDPIFLMMPSIVEEYTINHKHQPSTQVHLFHRQSRTIQILIPYIFVRENYQTSK